MPYQTGRTEDFSFSATPLLPLRLNLAEFPLVASQSLLLVAFSHASSTNSKSSRHARSAGLYQHVFAFAPEREKQDASWWIFLVRAPTGYRRPARRELLDTAPVGYATSCRAEPTQSAKESGVDGTLRLAPRAALSKQRPAGQYEKHVAVRAGYQTCPMASLRLGDQIRVLPQSSDARRGPDVNGFAFSLGPAVPNALRKTVLQ
eukprot:scaffold1504_cov417-Prasinococcus_capsulatus_cf.AAC.81